jgi:hypothetical protein
MPKKEKKKVKKIKETKKEGKEEKKEKKEKEEKEEPQTKGICLICQKEAIGLPIREDFVIRGIRKIKTAFKVARGSKLIVCNEHLEEARKKRERFEKTLLTYGGSGGVIGILLIIASILGGRDLLSILSVLLIAVLLIFILVIFSLAYYLPAVEEKK